LEAYHLDFAAECELAREMLWGNGVAAHDLRNVFEQQIKAVRYNSLGDQPCAVRFCNEKAAE